MFYTNEQINARIDPDYYYRIPLLGAICGDIIGRPFESYHPDAIVPKNFKLITEESTFSDDTVVSLAVAKWLTEGTFNINNLISNIQSLCKKYPKRGYGERFWSWVNEEYPHPYQSYGNGAVMRLSAIAPLLDNSRTWNILPKIITNITHDSNEAIEFALIYTRILSASFCCNLNISGSALDFAKDILSKHNCSIKTPDQIIKDGYKRELRCSKSVPEAICCFIYSNSFEETVRNAVLLRGDTDTQACIAGSLAAARWGVPKGIAKMCLSKLPDDLYEIYEQYCKHFYLIYE